jgi:predicted nucleic acid-binding protein
MIAALDSSVIVAALDTLQPFHRECLDLLRQPGLHARAHALAESFSTLTGGRLSVRMSADNVVRALKQTILPRVTILHLTAEEYLSAMGEAQSRGIRGGAIYDYLHLVAARKSGAERLYTLNVSDFRSFHRAGDPEIVHP